MSIVEALRGISHDISTRPTLSAKIQALQRYSIVLGKEVLGIVSMAPFAVKSYLLYQRLASNDSGTAVSLTRDVRYGPAPRNVLDVYRRRNTGSSDPKERGGSLELRTPAGGTTTSYFVDAVGARCMKSRDGACRTAMPVVLFVHGGVWASGSKWHYAKMATRLAEEGITTCVAEYTLFPQTTSEHMTKEVGEALDWVVGNCVEGNDQKVVLVGHSAGAHLCAMLMLERAGSSAYVPESFVGMAGVYDIARHYEYEKSRNVHHLSTMKRAVGGKESFAGQSPAVILREKAEDGVDVRQLPKVHLMASRSDITVPHLESADLHELLVARGCPTATLTLYDDVGHGDFVVEWKPRRLNKEEEGAVQTEDRAASGRENTSIDAHTSDLPVFAKDLIEAILSVNAKDTK